jgi:hypothetical protein
MFGFIAACLSHLGPGGHTQSEPEPPKGAPKKAEPQKEAQSEAETRTERQSEAELPKKGDEEMEGKAKDYTLTWTADPRNWKQAGDPQASIGHGNILPQEVRKILNAFDDDPDNPDIALCELNWREMVKVAMRYPTEEWELGTEPMRKFDGGRVVADLQAAGIRIDVMGLKNNNLYGAWLMDAIYTEVRCTINISRPDVEYVAVPNEAYKAVPVEWPETWGLEGWNAENTGNIWEAWAGTLWLNHQKMEEGTSDASFTA